MRSLLNRIANPFVSLLLRSPLHGLFSRSVLLMTVTGRRSGRPIIFPVQYAARGDDLLVVSRANRRWWRNLEGGAPVTVLLRGKTRTGFAEVQPGRDGASGRIEIIVTAH